MNLKVRPMTWTNRPAMTRVSPSSPAIWRLFAKVNAGEPYTKQVKPFNFVLSAHLTPDGHPNGANPEHFHLIAPIGCRHNISVVDFDANIMFVSFQGPSGTCP